MLYISLAAVIGILIVQAVGAIPQSSVGGPLTIALVFIAAALAVGIHDAWTQRRGVFGWIVNILIAFVGAFIGAQLAGDVIVMLIGAVLDVQGSLARTEGLPLSLALVAGMLANLASAWGALWVVGRWRYRATNRRMG